MRTCWRRTSSFALIPSLRLDFEYCGWGFYLYDLAPLLWQLKGERASDYLMLGGRAVARIHINPTDPDSDRELLEPYSSPQAQIRVDTLAAGKPAESDRCVIWRHRSSPNAAKN